MTCASIRNEDARGPRKYRASDKRQATKEQNRAAIHAAAWEIFCKTGLDGANIRDIVNRSGVSPGTFYNYSRTKEAIFDLLSQDLLERIRIEIRAARANAQSLEQLLSLGYSRYLDLLHSIDGALDFIGRNQHHIRAQLYPSSAMSGLITDLEEDLRRFIPTAAMSKFDRTLVCSIVIAAGAEAIFQTGRASRSRTNYLSGLLTKLMIEGLSGWRPETPERGANA